MESIHGDLYVTKPGEKYKWAINLWQTGQACIGSIDPPFWHKGFTTEKGAKRAGARVMKKLGLKQKKW